MSKLKNERRRRARRYVMREWAREVATPTYPPAWPEPCWFRLAPSVSPRLFVSPTSGRRWKKQTEQNRLTRKMVDRKVARLAADVLTTCQYCGVEISDHGDDGAWSAQGHGFGGTGTGGLTERHWCEESPDHEHAPLY